MGIIDRIAGQLGDLIAPDEVRERIERGTALLDAGDLDAAVRELSWAAMRAPEHARAAYLLGVALARKGELDAAARALEQALQLRPELGEAELALGEVLRRLGRVDEALERLRRALELGLSDPELLAEAYRGRGAIHLLAGRTDKAVRELRKAAAALPGDGESNRLLGLALVARADLDGARLCLEKAAAAFSSAAPAGGVQATGTKEAAATEAEHGEPPFPSRPAADAPGAPATAETPPPPTTPPPRGLLESLVALGEVYRRLGRRTEAAARVASALAALPGSRGALLVRARLHADQGDAAAALPDAEAALSGAPAETAGEAQPPFDALAARVLFDASDLPAAARLQLGRASALAGDPDRALAAFDDALGNLEGPPRRQLLDEALHVALSAGRDTRAAGYAAARLGTDGADGGRAIGPAASKAVSDALAALALGRLAAGDPVGAGSLVERALAVDGVEARLAQARLQLARGQRTAAAATLRLAGERALADPRPRARLAELYRAEHEPAHKDLYALLISAHRQLQKTPETSDLAPEAARVVEILDRPLLLTVMGEFNAGKSTFVNALLGEQVAPMGITPTTATINVVKYGAERGGRVVYRDDTLRHVPWSEVGPLLRALDETEATRIRFVEVLYPLEVLQRVNIVDTPGLNSIRPEHEATAREFVAQADAVLWLFSCRQPGTASEREALRRIRDEGRKVLGVVNMIDLVGDDEAARGEVLRHLREGFGDLVEALVPFSAREALFGAGDVARLARSNRAALESALAEHFFDRAKAIQREVATRRLGLLLDEARRRSEALLGAVRAPEMDRVEDSTRAAAQRLLGPFLDEERQHCIDRLADLFGQAAREVLDFVKPRRWPFSVNEAQKADRDFLLQLVEQQLRSLADGSRARVEDETRAAAAFLRSLAPAEAEALVVDQMQRAEGLVYGRYRSFTRGFLRGGRVDDFFTRALPRLDLGEQAIERALLRDMPALAVLDEELLAPLAEWVARFVDELQQRLRRLRQAEELRRFEIEERLLAPLLAMAAALEEMAAGSSSPAAGVHAAALPGRSTTPPAIEPGTPSDATAPASHAAPDHRHG